MDKEFETLKEAIAGTPEQIVRRYCSPWLGAENDMPNVFGRYGHTVSNGIYDKWEWNDSVVYITMSEAYEMVTLSEIYWTPLREKMDRDYAEYRRLDSVRKYFMKDRKRMATYFAECPQEKAKYFARFPEEKDLYERA